MRPQASWLFLVAAHQGQNEPAFSADGGEGGQGDQEGKLDAFNVQLSDVVADYPDHDSGVSLPTPYRALCASLRSLFGKSTPDVKEGFARI